MQDIVVRVKNRIQLQAALSYNGISTVIADYGCAMAEPETLRNKAFETRIFLQLPDVLREKKTDSVRKIAERAAAFDGIAVKNLDEIGLLKETGQDKKPMIGDAFLYSYNTDAIAFYRSCFPQMQFILSDELTDREALELICAAKEKGIAEEKDFIFKAYGYQPVMITNQCLNRNYAGCRKPLMEFADEKRNRFYITSECGQCYDIVYNSLPTVMLDKKEELAAFRNLLLDFTVETEEEMKKILNGFLRAQKEEGWIPEKKTRGHHYKETE